MAKTQPSRRRRQAELQETEEAMRARGVIPFLRPTHVENREWLKLTGFNARFKPGTDQEQIACEVENENGTFFTLGVRDGSPDHRVLFRALGSNWKTWSGSVQVTIVTGRNGDTQFVNVMAADPEPPVWDGSGPPHPADTDEQN